jgi:hypothetical protein
MMASLLFSGLDVEELIWQSIAPSPPRRESAWLTGVGTSRLLKFILLDRSKLRRSGSAGLAILLLFSCPEKYPGVPLGGALPVSDA